MRRARRVARAGGRAEAFTLLEVLAAVLVLGLLYSVLADVAIQGLRSEGETNRRLAASLLADRVLAEFEEQMAAGTVPPIGKTETEEEPFYVDVTVQPLEMPVGVVDPESGEGQAIQQLLGGGSNGQEPRLRSIEIRVAWFEIGNERSVVRTTFALDRSGLEGLLPSEEGGEAGSELPQLPELPDLNDLGDAL